LQANYFVLLVIMLQTTDYICGNASHVLPFHILTSNSNTHSYQKQHGKFICKISAYVTTIWHDYL